MAGEQIFYSVAFAPLYVTYTERDMHRQFIAIFLPSVIILLLLRAVIFIMLALLDDKIMNKLQRESYRVID